MRQYLWILWLVTLLSYTNISWGLNSEDQSRPSYFLGTAEVDPKDGWLKVYFRSTAIRAKLPLAFELFYSSNSRKEGILGQSWLSNFETTLQILEDENKALLFLPDHSFEVFERTGSGVFRSRTGRVSWIREEPSGWVWQRDDQKWHFNSQGQLTKIERGRHQLVIERSGNKISRIRSSLGWSLRFSYQQGRLGSIHASNGLAMKFRYNSQGKLSYLQDFEGRIHHFQYNKRGKLTSVNEKALQVTYNAGDQVVSLSGDAVPHRYYSYLRLRGKSRQAGEGAFLTEEADGLGNVTYYQYSQDEMTVRLVDPLGRVTMYYFNERQLPKRIVRPGFRVYRFRYDENGQLLELTDPDGKATHFNYDSKGQLTAVTRADGQKIRFEYNRQGDLVAIHLPEGLAYRFRYNRAGQLATIQTPEGLVQHYSYDSQGRLASKRDNRGLNEHYRYDSQGRLIELRRGELQIRLRYTALPQGQQEVVLENNLGMKIRAKVNAAGQILEYTDPRGKTVRYTYNSQGMTERIEYPNGTFASFSYDEALNLTSLIDPGGRIFSFSYDGVGNQVLRRDPDGSITKIAFNALDLESKITLPNGRTIQCRYDKLGRLLERRSPEGVEKFGYDTMGNLIWMKNQHAEYEIRYDSLGRPVELWDKVLNARLRYTYNSQGLRSSMTGPFGTIRYFYDRSGRIQKIVGPKGETFRYVYGPLGLPKAVHYPNGVVTTYTYDALGRTTEILSRNSAGKVILRRKYTYDRRGLRRTEEDERGRVKKYVYDLRGQLVKVVETLRPQQAESSSSAKVVRTVRYRYDNAGNRVALQENQSRLVYAYDLNGRVVLRGKVRYLYDKMGNLKAKLLPEGRVSYSYNNLGRLEAVRTSQGELVTFGYAPNGARVWKKNSQGLTRYLYDFEDVVAEFRNGKLVAYYLHGMGIDEPLGMFRRGKRPRYYHTDAQGSVVAMTDPSGALKARYAYKAFGEVILEWGMNEENPYRFSGRWYDAETGLYYYRSRYYDPQDGRFTSADPVLFGGGMNLYAYCGNDPVNYVDPWGTSRTSVWGYIKGAGKDVGYLLGIGDPDQVRLAREAFREAFFSRNTVRNVVAFGRGFGKGVWSGVKGIYYTVRHPIRTAKAIYSAVENFDETKALLGQLWREYVDAAKNDPERFSEMTGQLVGELAFAIVGTKGLDKVSKLSAVGKLRGVSKAAALKGMHRLSRFAHAAKNSALGRQVARLAPAGRVLNRGYQKLGGAYINRAAAKVAPWVLRKVKDMGRGYWNFTKKSAVPTIVAFNDRIEAAVKTYGTYDRAAKELNKNVEGALKKLTRETLSPSEAETLLQDIDASFDNYRDYLYKPVHEADKDLQRKLDELNAMAERGELSPSALESRLRKVLFEEYPERRLRALEEVYLKNRPPEGFSYIGPDGKLREPSRNRIASYDHQIQLYSYLKRKIRDPKIRESLESRIRELEERKKRDMQDFLEDKQVDLASEGMSDSPPIATEGAIEKLKKTASVERDPRYRRPLRR